MQITVHMGEIKVIKAEQSAVSPGLGSCVAVVLYDRKLLIGCVGHVMRPCIKEACDTSQPARFADMAVGMMVERMTALGSRIEDIWAKIFGGANMFPDLISKGSLMDVGALNILAVKQELKRYNIQIIAEEIGGHVGRSVFFDVNNGSVVVRSAYLEEKRY